MGINEVLVTVPVANDIILGEFKAYLNYGTPSQILLGATREGCKIDVDRTVKDIKSDGAYGYMLDSDGVPLVRYEKLKARVTLNMLYLKYFNKVKISDCESGGAWESNDWSGTGGTFAAETTIVNSGKQSSKCTIASGQTSHGIHEVFSSSMDLSQFSNGESFAATDYVTIAVYITTQDLADLGTDKIQLRFHNDSEGTETNYVYTEIEAADLTANQWNNLKILKSDFTAVAAGAWSGVTGVSLSVQSETDAELVFYVDNIGIMQNQSDSTLVPVNGSGFAMTNNTTYKEYRPDLEITNDMYLDNLTIVGQKADGKAMKIVAKNTLNDGKIELALENKDETVNETQFTVHYYDDDNLTLPLEIYEYVA